MRQLLMLGFYCEMYRREPLCRVYANDMLADEFNIPHTPYKDELWRDADVKLNPTYWSRDESELKSNTIFLKTIGFDIADQKSLDIRVEIRNDDNNYANGYMTKNTRVMLRQCWLAPVKVLEEFEQIQNRWRFELSNQAISVAQYYSGTRNYVLNNFAMYADMHFPGVNQQLILKEEERKKITNASNYQNLPQLSFNNPSMYWVGTSGHFHFKLVKKLGFWRHSTDRRRGWWKLSMMRNVKDIYNKYKSDEDKRSIDT